MTVIIAGVIAVDLSTAARTRAEIRRSGIVLAIFTGIMTAGYHLVVRGAMAYGDPPDPFEYLLAMHLFLVFFVARRVLLVSRRRRRILEEWHANRPGVLIVGVCVPLAYFFIIVALKSGNVTHIAAARNVGIVFSAAAGWLFLKERVTRLRAFGALWHRIGNRRTGHGPLMQPAPDAGPAPGFKRPERRVVKRRSGDFMDPPDFGDSLAGCVRSQRRQAFQDDRSPEILYSG